MSKLVIFILVAFISSSAFSQNYFSVNANVQVNTAYAQAVVVNTWPNRIHCKGYAYGQNSAGVWANSWMDAIIFPGQSAYVNVNANDWYNFPIVNGYAEIQCAFI